MCCPDQCAGFQWDYVFDWTILKYQQAAQPRPTMPPLEGTAVREARRTAQDEERERHQTSFNRSGTAEGSRRRCGLLACSTAVWQRTETAVRKLRLDGAGRRCLVAMSRTSLSHSGTAEGSRRKCARAQLLPLFPQHCPAVWHSRHRQLLCAALPKQEVGRCEVMRVGERFQQAVGHNSWLAGSSWRIVWKGSRSL